ncbi:Uncharacterised protein [Salmonella enterica]|nr:Uncharacterised protein [Salmonella enterica]
MRIVPDIPSGWNHSNAATAKRQQNIRYTCNPVIRINGFILNFAPATRFVKRTPSQGESRFICVSKMPGRAD